jgi:hypothetical protein
MRLWPVILLLLAACGGETRFDGRAWREADLASDERARMAPDLLRSGRLQTLDRAGVIQLLGRPTSTDKWADSELVYVLGPNSGLIAIDHRWLLIELDVQGQVVDARVVED